MALVVSAVAFMKTTHPFALLLICLLAAVGSGEALASGTQGKEPVRATATQPAVKKPVTAKPVKKAQAVVKKPAPVKKRKPIASKSKPAREVVHTPLPPAKLDLSLTPEMVKDLKPVGKVAAPGRTPLLPQMFGEKPPTQTPFQLNGRLISNEMELQLRNDSRREVEGAALEFEFKQ